MKRREILLYSSFFIISSLLAVNLVLLAYVNHGILNIANLFRREPSTKLSTIATCSPSPKRAQLGSASDLRLAKLAEYETICNSQFADKMMIFTNMPKDDDEAREAAQKMAKTLKEFEQHQLVPLVIVEPQTSWGLIDFDEYKTGFYDPWITTYFKELKKAGVTNKNIGYWVPFPEANLPYWNRKNATPADFAIIVNKYLKIGKAEFKDMHGSVLLNSATYESDDFDWERGDYTSLVPYVEGLDKSLISSFGLQGFPWSPPANRNGNGIYDAREFLNADLAIEAAKKIGVNEIWFNSGTFATKYAQDDSRKVNISAQKRKDVAIGEINEIKRARDKGYKVWFNIFAEDKSNVAEATNWSYIFTSDTSKEHQVVFTDIASSLTQEKIPISLYETK